ncbi:MAG: hypothetical protein CGW95_05760 [Phenylobacterium zucineum]|nr:MAG: hypothetical protein CGW95_05760 [Phenylobacterium zucineum]
MTTRPRRDHLACHHQRRRSLRSGDDGYPEEFRLGRARFGLYLWPVLRRQHGGIAGAIGRLAGVIIEGSAADFKAVGRDFVPGLAKPFVKVRVDSALNQFDYLGYVLAARAPVLLLSGTQDKVIRPARMREFAQALQAGGGLVTFAPVPAGHGGALESAEGREALAAFMQLRAGS